MCIQSNGSINLIGDSMKSFHSANAQTERNEMLFSRLLIAVFIELYSSSDSELENP